MDKKEKAKALYEQAKNLAKSCGSSAGATVYQECLELVKEAFHLYPKETYAKRMRELQEAIAAEEDSESSSDDDFSFVDVINQNKPPNQVTLKNQVKNEPSDSLDSYMEEKVRALNISENQNAHSRLDSPVSGPTEQDPKKSPRNNTPPKKVSKFVDVEGYKVETRIFTKLYGYQVEGVRWMFNLFRTSKKQAKLHPDEPTRAGCILADDMGLGKTVQSITFISTLLEGDHIKTALIVAPNTLLVNWGKEFKRWYPNIDVYEYHDPRNPKKRFKSLRTVQEFGGVLFTTYSLLSNHLEYFRECNGADFTWDVVVFDEAHKIKNPTQTTRAASEIPSFFRLAITGTPVQNNLRELWAIFSWTHKNELFGTYNSFKLNFERPITEARKKGASATCIRHGTRLADELKAMYAPYFLRRTKDEVMVSKNGRSSLSAANAPVQLPPKYDFVVWVQLMDSQVKAYKTYLESKEVQDVLRGWRNPRSGALIKLNHLLKICQSLNLIPLNMIEKINKEYAAKRRRKGGIDTSSLVAGGELIKIDDVDIEDLLDHAAKLQCLLALLQNLRAYGHRTLVFSQSVRVLDMIQRVLEDNNFQLARLDGQVKQKDRDKYITTFQESDTIEVMLLTTGVGGVGLTLTNADRVVIYDPSWNPGQDAQAIDRVYRIGQTKAVIVYRLITCSTVEERIFRRQIFKSSLFRQMVQNEADPFRYFSDSDIRELFKFGDPNVSETFCQIEEMHGSQREANEDVDAHRDEICSFPQVFHVTDYSLFFTLDADDQNEQEVDYSFVEREVAASNNRLRKEVEKQREERGDREYKPFDLPVSNIIRSDSPEIVYVGGVENPTKINDIVEIEDVDKSTLFKTPNVEVDVDDVLEVPDEVAERTNDPRNKRVPANDDSDDDIMEIEDVEDGNDNLNLEVVPVSDASSDSSVIQDVSETSSVRSEVIEEESRIDDQGESVETDNISTASSDILLSVFEPRLNSTRIVVSDRIKRQSVLSPESLPTNDDYAVEKSPDLSNCEASSQPFDNQDLIEEETPELNAELTIEKFEESEVPSPEVIPFNVSPSKLEDLNQSTTSSAAEASNSTIQTHSKDPSDVKEEDSESSELDYPLNIFEDFRCHGEKRGSSETPLATSSQRFKSYSSPAIATDSIEERSPSPDIFEVMQEESCKVSQKSLNLDLTSLELDIHVSEFDGINRALDPVQAKRFSTKQSLGQDVTNGNLSVTFDEESELSPLRASLMQTPTPPKYRFSSGDEVIEISPTSMANVTVRKSTRSNKHQPRSRLSRRLEGCQLTFSDEEQPSRELKTREF